MHLTLEHFESAYRTLRKIIPPTPLVYNEWLSQKYKCEVYLKLENTLPIGSFKMRGASYKISKIKGADKKRGVLAVSAGNHAQGVAWAAQKFKLKATIVMPITAPLTKIKNSETLGAKVVLQGTSLEDSFEYAQKMLKKEKMIFVHPYYDPDVIAGQGSVAFELLEQIPEMDYLFSSIGGGGLVSGMGQVLKLKKSKVKIIAGQATGCSAMVDSLQRGKPKSISEAETFADGIKVKNVVPEMFDLLKDCVHSTHAVSDEKIAWGVLQLLEKAKTLAEGAGALPLALFDQLYQKDPKKFKGKKIVLVICGGNIDVNLLERIIDRGLIESHRKVRIAVPIADRPGVLHELTRIIKNVGANVLHVVHDRDSLKTGVSGTNVYFTLETKGEEHLKLLIEELKKDFPLSQIIS